MRIVLLTLCTLVGCSCDMPPEPGKHPKRAHSVAHRLPERNASSATSAESVLAAQQEPPGPPRLAELEIPWDANRVLRTLASIRETLVESGYSSVTRVNEAQGSYFFDCSGMAQWVLRRAAPRALASSAYRLPHRPLARDFYRRIASVPKGKERFGWKRIARVDEALPGDVVAWIKPDIIRSPNTGHVAFLVLPPVLVPGYDNAYLVRIADASSLRHDEDSRDEQDGFGLGTILLVSDPETGEPVAYGWVGLRWRAFETRIAIGRPLH